MAPLTSLPGLAARISIDLAKAGIPHAISGAVAMAAHGYVRATKDVDILVVTSSLRLPDVFAAIRQHGFEGEDRRLITDLRQRFVACLHSGPVTVEVLVPVLPYHRTILDRAVRISVGGHDVPFVSIEDLIVLKMLWYRTKDIPDVHALVSSSPRLDADFIRATLRAILPDENPKHAALEEILQRFTPKP